MSAPKPDSDFVLSTLPTSAIKRGSSLKPQRFNPESSYPSPPNSPPPSRSGHFDTQQALEDNTIRQSAVSTAIYSCHSIKAALPKPDGTQPSYEPQELQELFGLSKGQCGSLTKKNLPCTWKKEDWNQTQIDLSLESLTRLMTTWFGFSKLSKRICIVATTLSVESVKRADLWKVEIKKIIASSPHRILPTGKDAHSSPEILDLTQDPATFWPEAYDTSPFEFI
ncbi:hypothetical protein BX600DRAFT_433782 [Xylariales sp. PMI_506]|nr:hypothetical protein BX600DRAFT_433782 [Xylariales sp. PMI_506]